MKYKYWLIIGILVAFAHDGFSQLDVKHWVPPFYAKPGVGTGQTNIGKHFVSLSTPSVDTIPVTIRNGFGDTIATVDISRDMPVEYVFEPLGNATTNSFPLNVIPTDSLNIPIRSQGLYFESYQPFFVNMRHKAVAQGTSLTTKGQSGLGKRFYSGHLYTIYNQTADSNAWNNQARSHFISVMATEDSTVVTFDMIKAPIKYIGHPTGEPFSVTLNAFESYVVGVDHSLYNDSTINRANGTRITSNKDIVCNTGSWLSGNEFGQCIGSDQIAPADHTGSEYILVRGLGNSSTEHPMVVATSDNTEVYINDETDPAVTLNEGEYYFIPTDKFTANDNMYVRTGKNAYMYQTLSGSAEHIGPTVGLSFIPSLNCVGAKRVVLPFVNSLAGGDGQGRINIITKSGTSIFVNDSPTPLTGAQSVTGIDNWVSYAFDPPSDNVTLESDSVMNVALLTRDANVGTAGYFSGFTVEPVVGVSALYPGTAPCAPGNALFSVFGFDTYQWYYEGEPIPGETGSTLIPQYSGEYTVEGFDLTCGFRFTSNPFSVPLCPSTLGVAKQDQEVEETAVDSKIFDVTYRMFVENISAGPALNLQIIDNIEGGLPVGATATLVSPPTLVFGVMTGGVNPSFDGVTDRRILPGNGSLPGFSADAVDMVVRVDMNAAEQDGYFNQVTVTSKDEGPNDGETGPFTGQDYSDDGSNPDPNGNGQPNEIGENDPTLTCFFTNEITYGSNELCVTNDSAQVIQDGINSGLFTADSEGLAIDSITGTIDLAESQLGTYTVTLTTEGRCPTVTTTEITLFDDLSSGTAVEDVTICESDEPVDLSEFLEGEDEGGFWSYTGGDVIDGDFIPDSIGTFGLTYTQDNGVCGFNSTDVEITIVTAPDPGTPVENPTACESEEAVDLSEYLSGEDAGGVWTDGEGDPTNVMFTPPGPGEYAFDYTVSNEVCGPISTSLILTVEKVPEAGTSLGVETLCPGDTVLLDNLLVGNDDNGEWSDADGNPVDSIYVASEPGDYSFMYMINTQACPPDSAHTGIEVLEGGFSGVAPDEAVMACPTDPVVNLFELLEGADPGGVWTRADGTEMPNGLFLPQTTGLFTFTYTVNDEFCGEMSTELEINVTDDECLHPYLIVPEGFSPNGDGIGDYWIIRGLDFFPNNHVTIFNRWGNEVFSATPYNNDWNGKAKSGLNAGEVLPVGTYWYILDLGDGSEPRRGFIYLNR